MVSEAEGGTSNMEVEEGEEGSTGGGGADQRVEDIISSENSGPTRSRSEDDFEDEDDDGDGDNKHKKKKRKKYHRHAAEQIRVMEACVKILSLFLISILL